MNTKHINTIDLGKIFYNQISIKTRYLHRRRFISPHKKFCRRNDHYYTHLTSQQTSILVRAQ